MIYPDIDASPKIRHTRKKLHATMQVENWHKVYHECSCIQMRFIPLISSIPLSPLLSKHIFIYIVWSPQSFFQRFIYSPVIFPRDYLYIGTTDFVTLMCHAREVFPRKGFSSGASIAEKWGLEIFWGKCHI